MSAIIEYLQCSGSTKIGKVYLVSFFFERVKHLTLLLSYQFHVWTRTEKEKDYVGITSSFASLISNCVNSSVSTYASTVDQ